MMKDREYLRAFRCFGGFILLMLILINIFANLEVPLQLIFYNISEEIVNHTAMLGSMLGFAYTYYLGYRIFIKRFDLPLFDFGKMKKNRLLMAVIDIVAAFVMVRVIWHLQLSLLDILGYETVSSNEKEPLFAIIYSVLIAPVMEETVFRGWLLTLLKKYGIIPAVMFTSVAFGLFHGTVLQSLPAIFIGLVLAYLTLKYHSLLPAIAVHVTSNAASVFSTVFPEEQFMQYLLIASAVILVIWLIRNARDLFYRRKELPLCFKLSLKSLSWAVFCLLSAALVAAGFFLKT